ncbi:hypothetical protein JTB14_007931 [Gonioctena quinquepunctata]|nr:hypothetical protein JTB14_007931 [Gonioctena quinquepunctata]
MGSETEPDEQEHEEDVPEEHSQEVIQAITNKNKKHTPQPVGNKDKKTPPIVIEGRMEMPRRVAENMKGKLKGQYTVDYKYRSTLIYTTNAEDHMAMQKLLLETGTQFHTYTHKAEKTHAFVIKGLESAPTPEELEEALKEEHQLKERVKRIEERKALSNKGNRGAEFRKAPPVTSMPWGKHNQNLSLKSTQQPREERRIQPTQGSPSIPPSSSQVVSGVSGGVSENRVFSFEDITNRIKKVNSLIDLPKMVRRLDSLINDITNARGDEEQFMALVRYSISGCGNL